MMQCNINAKIFTIRLELETFSENGGSTKLHDNRENLYCCKLQAFPLPAPAKLQQLFQDETFSDATVIVEDIETYLQWKCPVHKNVRHF